MADRLSTEPESTGKANLADQVSQKATEIMRAETPLDKEGFITNVPIANIHDLAGSLAGLNQDDLRALAADLQSRQSGDQPRAYIINDQSGNLQSIEFVKNQCQPEERALWLEFNPNSNSEPFWLYGNQSHQSNLRLQELENMGPEAALKAAAGESHCWRATSSPTRKPS